MMVHSDKELLGCHQKEKCKGRDFTNAKTLRSDKEKAGEEKQKGRPKRRNVCISWQSESLY